jgi:hypothetical protein
MQDSTISLIVSFFALGMSVASWLHPVKEWIRYLFPSLWPPQDRNDASTSRPSEPSPSDTDAEDNNSSQLAQPQLTARELFLIQEVVAASTSALALQIEALRAELAARRVETLSTTVPSRSSDLDGG